jgi:DeoR family fructose operon transcriptional repressor
MAEVYAPERQREIVQRARRDGRVEVAALAEHFGVTTETVRRDLTRLERQGEVRRVHGGALPIEQLGFELDYEERMALHRAEKERIGLAAVDLLPEEGTVLIDAGTTTARLVGAFPSDRELVVTTNSLPLAQLLVTRPNVTVLMPGGRLRPRTLAQVDVWTQRVLAELHVDVAFIATNGISTEHGLTTPDVAEAEIKRAMIRAGARVVLLADSSKVGQRHFIRFGDIEQIDVMITDTGLDDRAATEFRALGVDLLRV